MQEKETACKDCIENDIEVAVYVGESARSGAERMGEHVDDAESGKKDSHMFKHWSTQHEGEKTSFSFKIISFFSSPLERQFAEAVRILNTGAKRILNSKGMYNRCSLPRIVAKDMVEEATLGDSEKKDDDEARPEQEPVLPTMSKKSSKPERQ